MCHVVESPRALTPTLGCLVCIWFMSAKARKCMITCTVVHSETHTSLTAGSNSYLCLVTTSNFRDSLSWCTGFIMRERLRSCTETGIFPVPLDILHCYWWYVMDDIQSIMQRQCLFWKGFRLDHDSWDRRKRCEYESVSRTYSVQWVQAIKKILNSNRCWKSSIGHTWSLDSTYNYQSGKWSVASGYRFLRTVRCASAQAQVKKNHG